MVIVLCEGYAKGTRKRMADMTTMVRPSAKALDSAVCVLKVSSLSLLDHISVPHNHQHHHDLH